MPTAKKCIKSLLFAFNVVFMLSGFAAVGSGIWMLFDPGRFDRYLGNYQFLYPASILIATGIFVMIVSFCGCCGAIKEHRCMLGTYFTMLLLILCAEVAAGVLGFLFQDHIEVKIKEQADVIVKQKYGTGLRDLDYTVDLLQEKLKCCGAKSETDYSDSQWIKHSAQSGKYVPNSCCSDPSRCIKQTVKELVFKDGCNDSLSKLLMRSLTILGGIGIGLACIQLLGMGFSCCLFCSIEH